MCAPCWHQVPPDLQARIYRTWRAVQRSDFGDAEIAAYQAARDAALGLIR